MRHFKNFMILVMTLTVVTLTSCSSDDSDDGDDSGTPAAELGTISAKVNGTTVTSVEIATFATLSNGNLQIQGNTGGTSSKAFVFNIIGFNDEGTYPIGGGANIFNSGSYTETDVDLNDPTNPEIRIWQAPYDDTQVGEIIISEITETYIKGTFSFSAKRNEDDSIVNVTEGSFNIEFM